MKQREDELAETLRALAIEANRLTDRLTIVLTEVGIFDHDLEMAKSNVNYRLGEAASVLAQYGNRDTDEVLCEMHEEAEAPTVDLVRKPD